MDKLMKPTNVLLERRKYITPSCLEWIDRMTYEFTKY